VVGVYSMGGSLLRSLPSPLRKYPGQCCLMKRLRPTIAV
jgi:hypothetical protein